MYYLGIEIGGTKLQMALGRADGSLIAPQRERINPAEGSDGIRRQIASTFPKLLAESGVAREQIARAGIGFGGPVDTDTQRVITSHQIAGWDNFPLAQWAGDLLKMPVTIGNDADVAGLGEALFGAGRGFNPVFYITIGSGIGGGLIIDNRIYRGAGKGAAEIGHVAITREFDGQTQTHILEHWASGWAIQNYARQRLIEGAYPDSLLRQTAAVPIEEITTEHVAKAAKNGDGLALHAIERGRLALADGIGAIIALLCPKRIIIGGGVSLLGDDLLFTPLRKRVAELVFKPFANLTEIVPAALGEWVVPHGALALAQQASAGQGA